MRELRRELSRSDGMKPGRQHHRSYWILFLAIHPLDTERPLATSLICVALY